MKDLIISRFALDLDSGARGKLYVCSLHLFAIFFWFFNAVLVACENIFFFSEASEEESQHDLILRHRFDHKKWMYQLGIFLSDCRRLTLADQQ